MTKHVRGLLVVEDDVLMQNLLAGEFGAGFKAREPY